MIDHVRWPSRYDPKTSALYALNDIDVEAPADVVWRMLVRAKDWSSYFAPEDQVEIEGEGSELALGVRFTRVTVGIPCKLVVEECELNRRLAWSTLVEGDDTGSSAYHGWVITPTAGGCYVVSEETQQGPFFVRKLGVEQPGGLFKYHQQWVEDLKRGAETQAKAAG